MAAWGGAEVLKLEVVVAAEGCEGALDNTEEGCSRAGMPNGIKDGGKLMVG